MEQYSGDELKGSLLHLLVINSISFSSSCVVCEGVSVCFRQGLAR